MYNFNTLKAPSNKLENKKQSTTHTAFINAHTLGNTYSWCKKNERLKMEAASSFETSVTVYKSTLCHVPEDLHIFTVSAAKLVLDISIEVCRLLKITNKILVILHPKYNSRTFHKLRPSVVHRIMIPSIFLQ
jgi:hypothetical protein